MKTCQCVLCVGLLALAACGTDASAGSGDVRLFIQAEATIRDGLQPGDGPDDVQDGWTVRFDKFLFVVGRVRARSTAEGTTLSAKDAHLLDLSQIPTSGYRLLDDDSALAIRYDEVSFDNPVADDSTEVDTSVDDGDAERMRAEGWSILIEGAIERAADAPSEVRFAWGFPASTRYEHCGPEEGDLGFAVSSGGTTTASFTIHGDHWFFNGFPEGAEVVTRRAQWIATADLDANGETTLEELRDTPAGKAFPVREYSLAGAPDKISNAYDFALAQARTLGHFQGEGECEWDVLE